MVNCGFKNVAEKKRSLKISLTYKRRFAVRFRSVWTHDTYGWLCLQKSIMWAFATNTEVIEENEDFPTQYSECRHQMKRHIGELHPKCTYWWDWRPPHISQFSRNQETWPRRWKQKKNKLWKELSIWSDESKQDFYMSLTIRISVASLYTLT